MQRITRTVPFLHWEQIPCRFQGKYSHLLSVSLKVSAIVLAVVTQSEFLCRPSGLQEPNWHESTGFSSRFTHFTYCRKREFHVVGFWTSTSSRPEKLADTVSSVNTHLLTVSKIQDCAASRLPQVEPAVGFSGPYGSFPTPDSLSSCDYGFYSSRIHLKFLGLRCFACDKFCIRRQFYFNDFLSEGKSRRSGR